MRLIDVDALLAQMEECYERRAEEANMTGDRAVCVTWNDAVFIIKNAPTVDAVPVRHGKWIEKHHAYSDEESVIEEWQSCRCSECGRYDTRPYIYYFDEPNYCSYCGAKMDEEKEE